ncbi:hypothetical protein [Zooshikella harenae]|uniref:Cold shock domain-containing protein n=1 Tax=Zooshikella harenae TaxID=2827238 RepID=A0ABS5ZBX3_9GAMM|nr:hypothetical protein [Zooshikella harenae]MBU2711559.1 hypothetical protein [Zooshikella harenae]
MRKGYQGFRKGKKKSQGKGILEAINTDGPHKEWLGMPEYYIHTLTVDGENYNYLSAEQSLEVQIGDMVVFRYEVVGSNRRIDKRSLGKAIDPSQYQAPSDND